MGGFKSPAYRLEWPEGHELHGLVVRARGLSIGDLKVVSSVPMDAKGIQQLDAVGPLLDVFADRIISWNLVDEKDEPVGTSREDMAQADMRTVLPVVMAWVTEVSSIPDPLPKGSNSGQQFPEVSIPMEMSLPNLTNLPSQS